MRWEINSRKTSSSSVRMADVRDVDVEVSPIPPPFGVDGVGEARGGGGGGNEEGERPMWGSTTEFILAAIGSAVGLGNLLRFPYMVFSHGGAAFLVPYALAVLLLGIPILGMELMLGQVLQRGVCDGLAMLHARAWGIGVAATLGSFLLASYYSAILSWVWCFLLASMNEVVPWSDGRARDFFYVQVLGQASSQASQQQPPLADGLGPCKWWLVVGLVLNWLVVYACIYGGAKSAGKAVWITMPLPYLLLFVLLVKGATLEGANEGLSFYLWRWSWEAFAHGDTWVDAVAQIFFGLSIACGAMPAYGSGCAKTEKIGRNTWVIGLSNSATSIYAGFVVFTFLGHLARQQGTSVPDVAEGGWGLAFIVYPTAMATFGGSGGGQFFAVCFWVMLLCLGVDSAFALIEAPITLLCDRFPWCAANREITAAAACFFGFVIGLPMTTAGGYYVVDIMDAYVSRYTLIIAGMCECLFIGHVYGADRLQDDARRLCGSGVARNGYFPFAIKWVAPTILGALLGYNISQEAKGTTYGGYPRWAIAVFGWIICVVIPLSFVAYGCYRPLHLIRPREDEEDHDEGEGGGGGRGRCTEMSSLNNTNVTSDNYREEEEEEECAPGTLRVNIREEDDDATKKNTKTTYMNRV